MAHYNELAASWRAGMTKQERSAEMSRRRRKGLKRRGPRKQITAVDLLKEIPPIPGKRRGGR